VDRARALRALACFGSEEPIEPLGRGLINETWLAGAFVLQRLAPIFDPTIHHNIRAVTERLAERGLTTPRLRPTKGGELWADLGEDGVWRMYDFVPGRTFEALPGGATARAAGELVGRFHRALEDLDHRFTGMRLGVHDTAAHLGTLERALAEHAAHRLHAQVAPIGEAILEAAAALEPLPSSRPWVCHGDLKIANVVFDARDRAVCLVDLDTVGPMALAYEMGDALRSWCNPAGEVLDGVRFDLDLHAAAVEGWRAGLGRASGEEERAALLHGVEWVSVELAARFAADALRERYFGWDRERYQSAGEHHLARARGQLALHRAAVGCRAERAKLG
jgi:Ser/Thr protein kinase RdoA (MazF antagonist)